MVSQGSITFFLKYFFFQIKKKNFVFFLQPDDEFCIIIEDDLEVSPFWYTWLKKSWLKYQDREDIAGIGKDMRL